jgi:hypothetical protein
MMKRVAVFLSLACLPLCVDANPGVPVVYRDDNVVIHAGVVDASRGAARLGDALTLYVGVRFDPDTVRVTGLDDAFFQRVFADRPAFRLVAQSEESRSRDDGGIAVVEREWQFVVVGCPDAGASCPGERRYELPIAIIDYDVLSAGRSSQRAARLTPWPGTLTLASAFPDAMPADASLGDWLPGAALPMPGDSERPRTAAMMSVTAGVLLLLLGTAGRAPAPTRPSPRRTALARWERVAAALEDAGLGDDEWLDRYRRCVVCYLVDVEHASPFSREPVVARSEARRLLDDVIELTQVDDRAAWLDRLFAATGAQRIDGVRS